MRDEKLFCCNRKHFVTRNNSLKQNRCTLPVDVSIDAVSQGLEKEAILGWLLREILLESQAPPPVGVERLIHCHVRSNLQGTAARIVEELKHLPENIIRLSKVPPKAVFRIRIRFLRIRIQGFFLNPDPVPDPDPGKEKTFRKAIQKNLGVPTNMVLIYLYF